MAMRTVVGWRTGNHIGRYRKHPVSASPAHYLKDQLYQGSKTLFIQFSAICKPTAGHTNVFTVEL